MRVQSVSIHVYKVTMYNIYNTYDTSGGKNRDLGISDQSAKSMHTHRAVLRLDTTFGFQD